jgi:hypothetical protein
MNDKNFVEKLKNIMKEKEKMRKNIVREQKKRKNNEKNQLM